MKDRLNIHQHIADQIATAIERGAGQFDLSCHSADGAIMQAINVASKKPYRDVNTVALGAAAEHIGFGPGPWGTYRQSRGCSDRELHKATSENPCARPLRYWHCYSLNSNCTRLATKTGEGISEIGGLQHRDVFLPCPLETSAFPKFGHFECATPDCGS